MNRTITIDELPRYSPWPARLLGLAEFNAREKTAANVLREYNEDKWGAMLRLFDRHAISSVEDLEALVEDSAAELACLVDGELRVMGLVEAHRLYFEAVSRRLAAYADASALVEFGCGYGAMLLRLARDPAFRHLPIVGTEFAPNGVKVFEQLAARSGIACRAGACDLTQNPITPIAVPPGALLCTVMALPCIPTLDVGMFKALAALRPAVVCHIEPVPEFADETSMLGLLTRRYAPFNRYATGIMDTLRRAEAEGVLEIIATEPAIFGMNPLLPASFIAWRPRAVVT